MGSAKQAVRYKVASTDACESGASVQRAAQVLEIGRRTSDLSVMRKVEDLFDALSRSRFRAKFALGPEERTYLHMKGRSAVLAHARDFIERRLAPAYPVRDGKQTPMRGHPVFLAQHATATCCRGCLEKWHGIPRGRALSDAEQGYIVDVIARWIHRQDSAAPDLGEPTLFDLS
jgi:hypothetical protein